MGTSKNGQYVGQFSGNGLAFERCTFEEKLKHILYEKYPTFISHKWCSLLDNGYWYVYFNFQNHFGTDNWLSLMGILSKLSLRIFDRRPKLSFSKSASVNLKHTLYLNGIQIRKYDEMRLTGEKQSAQLHWKIKFYKTCLIKWLQCRLY